MFNRIRTSLLIAGMAVLVPFGAEFVGIDYEQGETQPPKLTDAADEKGDNIVISDAGRDSTNAPSPAPAPTGDAYECGNASYYADSLAGNGTSSGQPYDPRKYTAAHKTLPFGTKLRVVRTDNNKSVNVVVNDRGPFTPGRVTDLSRAAAEDIGLVIDGVTEVCLYIR